MTEFDSEHAHDMHTPTPPRVMSELEGELLEALKWMHQHVLELCLTHNHPIPQASLDRSTAAIKKAEAQQ